MIDALEVLHLAAVLEADQCAAMGASVFKRNDFPVLGADHHHGHRAHHGGAVIARFRDVPERRSGLDQDPDAMSNVTATPGILSAVDETPVRRRSYKYYDILMVAFTTVLICSEFIAASKLARASV